MKYLFTISGSVEIEAENVAQAFKQAKKLDLIPRLHPAASDQWMGSGSHRPKNNRERIRHSVKRLGSMKVRLETA